MYPEIAYVWTFGRFQTALICLACVFTSCAFTDKCEISNKKHNADALGHMLAEAIEQFYQWKEKTQNEVSVYFMVIY